MSKRRLKGLKRLSRYEVSTRLVKKTKGRKRSYDVTLNISRDIKECYVKVIIVRIYIRIGWTSEEIEARNETSED